MVVQYANWKLLVLLVMLSRKPAVIMVVGVNGGGKTTSLGKKLNYAILYLYLLYVLRFKY